MNFKARPGSLVRYRYPHYDIGVVLTVKPAAKLTGRPTLLIYWPDTDELATMTDLMLEVVSY